MREVEVDVRCWFLQLAVDVAMATTNDEDSMLILLGRVLVWNGPPLASTSSPNMRLCSAMPAYDVKQVTAG